MSKQPLVSVVIATYNMGQYLPLAIDSVLNQTWSNLEVIVIDDGSQDDTKEKMIRYENDSRVRYIPTENRGQPKAKNRGLNEAKGDYIAFCDADDLWMPLKLQLQIPKFDDPRVGVVYSEVSYIDEFGCPVDKEVPYLRFSGKITEHLVLKNFVPFGTAVFRRSCIKKNGQFDESLPMGIDWDLWLRFSIDWHFYYISERTYIYRVWPGQMSKNYRGRYENAFHILRKFIDLFPDSIPNKLKNRAWADMYCSRGISLARSEHIFYEPLRDILIGLRYDWSYYPAWKSLAKLFLKRD